MAVTYPCGCTPSLEAGAAEAAGRSSAAREKDLPWLRDALELTGFASFSSPRHNRFSSNNTALAAI